MLFLTDQEQELLFAGIRRRDAQIRFLQRQGIGFVLDARNRARVLRASLESDPEARSQTGASINAASGSTWQGPDESGFIDQLSKRRLR